MQGKKGSISFDDLNLDVKVPDILTKSARTRKLEEVEKKKFKKEREKAAVSVVSLSRELIQKRKHQIELENEDEQNRKEMKRKALRLEQIKSQNQREEQSAKERAAFIASQKRMFQSQDVVNAENERQQQEIKRRIEEEEQATIKQMPPSVHIPVFRTEEIIEQRSTLPVVREEQPIMEAINNCTRTCVLISGETGSGKTTQLPQFLWEAGYGHSEGSCFGREGCVLVTEPRRVAAVAMAKRVAEELNVVFGDEVCYHVRYDNNMSENCKIKFATEGLILKEIQSDFLLSRYSVVVVDEAHERSVSCDLLIGLLSRIVPLRNEMFTEQLELHGGDIRKTSIKPLRLIIMSATLQVADFRDNRKLFPSLPPLLQVEARRYPVVNHFARKTELKDYVVEAFRKVRQIHKKLPPGGVLVFLSTQREIENLCDLLQTHYAQNRIEYSASSYNKHQLVRTNANEEDSDSEENEERVKDEYGLEVGDYDLEQKGGGINVKDDEESLRLDRSNDPGRETSDAVESDDDEVNGCLNTLHVLPLYALLDPKKQQEVFRPVPQGKRLCVVATNVAETSLTIPNIKYVVDTGRAKIKVMDAETKASLFRIDWISQASSEQRSGRAGRMGPGHCYRLYSTAVFANVMTKHTIAEILRSPLDSVVLLMKQIGIEHVTSFPFPSSPPQSEVYDALTHLSVIGALEKQSFNITPLGRSVVKLPVPPRFARAIIEALECKCSQRMLHIVCAVVATISVSTTVFTAEGNRLKGLKKENCKDNEQALVIKALLNSGSDLVTVTNAFAAYYATPHKCAFLCLNSKSMREVKMLFDQLCFLVQQIRIGKNAADMEDDVADSANTTERIIPRLSDASSLFSGNFKIKREEELQVRQLFIPGLLDQVARRATVHECRLMGVQYNDKKASKAPYLLLQSNSIAFIHPTSSVSNTSPPPEYITFCFLQNVQRSFDNVDAKTLMMGVTIVVKDWLDKYNFTE